MSKKDCQKRQVCFAVDFAHCFETSHKTEFFRAKNKLRIFANKKIQYLQTKKKTREIKYI